MMKKLYLFFTLFTFVLCFIGCSKDDSGIDDNTPGNKPGNTPEKPEVEEIPEEFKDSYLNVSIQADGINVTEFYKDCYISSVVDEIPVSGASMKLQSNINKKVQTYFLTDGGDKIYQMTRVSDTEKNKKVEFTAKSSALAFITLHPLFAHIDSLAFDILEEVLIQCPSFSKLESEVKKYIEQKTDLYDSNNTTLLDALDSLLDELIVYDDHEHVMNNSRSLNNETWYFPIRLNSNGKWVYFQVRGVVSYIFRYC